MRPTNENNEVDWQVTLFDAFDFDDTDDDDDAHVEEETITPIKFRQTDATTQQSKQSSFHSKRIVREKAVIVNNSIPEPADKH